MQKPVGFGLGVAWNSLVAAAVPAAWSFRAHTLFLVLVMCLAASLVVPEPGASSLRQRHAELLSFASKVVCAFSLAGWLTYVTPGGLLGDLCAEVYLLFQAAAFSYLVANLDVDRPMGLPGAQGRKPDALERLVGCLVKVPCVWCCCPCIPLVWLMSRPHDGVKGRWLRLISDVSSLAASVVGTNLMTGGIDALAEAWQICGPGWCHVGAFLTVEVALAALASLTLLAAIVPLSPFPPPLPPPLPGTRRAAAVGTTSARAICNIKGWQLMHLLRGSSILSRDLLGLFAALGLGLLTWILGLVLHVRRRGNEEVRLIRRHAATLLRHRCAWTWWVLL